MKNQLMKLRKAEGYIGIETMIIAALVIATGFIALRFVMEDINGTASAVNYNVEGKEFDPFEFGS